MWTLQYPFTKAVLPASELSVLERIVEGLFAILQVPLVVPSERVLVAVVVSCRVSVSAM